jgi:hypothetical protein
MRKAQIEIAYSRPSSMAPRLPLRQGASKRIEPPIRLGAAVDSPIHRCSPSHHADSPVSICAQGDILLERVADLPATGDSVAEGDVVILAHGELSGHRHAAHGRVKLVYDAAHARDIPLGLYIGHLHVTAGSARLEHEEHGAIALQRGIYRVRRQRRLEPSDVAIIED